MQGSRIAPSQAPQQAVLPVLRGSLCSKCAAQDGAFPPRKWKSPSCPVFMMRFIKFWWKRQAPRERWSDSLKAYAREDEETLFI